MHSGPLSPTVYYRVRYEGSCLLGCMSGMGDSQVIAISSFYSYPFAYAVFFLCAKGVRSSVSGNPLLQQFVHTFENGVSPLSR